MKGYYTSQIVQIISYKILIGLKRPRAGLLRKFFQIYAKKKFFFFAPNTDENERMYF